MFIHKYKYSLLWASTILIACGINGNYIPQIHITDIFKPDSIAHLAMFGVLTFLIATDKIRAKLTQNTIQKITLQALIISVLYGVIIEILQATVFINRSYDYADMLANTIGCCIAAAIIFIKFWSYK